MNYLLEYPGSAILYITVVIMNTIFARIAAKQKNKQIRFLFVVSIILIYTLVAGFRGPSVGTDTPNYIIHINNWQNMDSYIQYPTEPGLKIISTMLSYVFSGFTPVLIIISLIINTLVVYRLWSYRFKISFEISILIYSFTYYFMTFSGIRQWLAIAVVFWASIYLFKKKYMKYLFYIILASLFHNTAILAIGIPIVDIFSVKYNYNKKKLLLSLLIIPPFLISVIIFTEYQFQLLSQYSSYAANIQLQGGTGFTLWIRVLIGISIYFLVQRDTFDKMEDYLFFKRNYRIYLIGLLLIIPGYYIANINRLAFYYTIQEIIVFGIIGKNSKVVVVKVLLIIILLFTGLLFVLELASSGLGHMPYIPFWENKLI